MARPGPDIIDSRLIDDAYTDILNVDCIYMLTYQGRPVSIRRRTQLVDREIYKYTKTQWPNKKTALNIAKKLNTQFMTTDFDVKEVS